MRYTILMYLAVDIGGTKTLVAIFDQDGGLKNSVRFPTPRDYKDFLRDLESALADQKKIDFKAACVAIPGKIDRTNGVVVGLGNLPWKGVPIEKDVENLAKCPALVENDAKLGGLYQAAQLSKKYKRVLYITIGTGVGIGLINNGEIDDAISDWGGKFLPVERGGKETTWEEIASGRAITKKYGKKASEITDPGAWRQISNNIAKGLFELIAITEPEAVVIGGGVGRHFDKFGDFINKELKTRELPNYAMPPVLPSVNSEESVVYGCYELLKNKQRDLK